MNAAPRRFALIALHVLVVGLALHNVVMASLWRAGVRGHALDAVAAWKDVLLVASLALLVGARGLPWRRAGLVDALALAYAAFVVAYGLLPQSWLGGGAGHRGVLYAARHDLLPVGGYFLGRGLGLSASERHALCRTVLGTAAGVAAIGLVDVFAVPLSFWRRFSGWYGDQLGLHYFGLSGLPENFVYNAGNGVVYRRLTSTFLSPLATAYLLVVAMFLLPLRRRAGLALGLLLFAAVLWTHTRAALVALAAGLLLLALVRRAARPLLFAAVAVVLGLAFVKGYGHVAPRTHFTPTELREQERHAAQGPAPSYDATAAGESSTSEHLSSLRAGVRTVLHHPWGYGLGNAGVTAERTSVLPQAGESTYTELGVETGVAGGLVFVAWSLGLLVAVARRLPWLAAAFAAVLVIGIQTDVIGVPWLAVVAWALAGSAVGSPGADGAAAGTPSARTGPRARPT
ncbi:MAG TPA: O-antigen ligase family protein [Gaiellaceae bacterium]|nr:O-antigen ligase family protein [Gaiellaceae bacterium]